MSSLPAQARVLYNQTVNSHAMLAPQIFVTYAHKDDEALPGASDGWVAALTRNVKAVLRDILRNDERFRSDDNFDIWVDRLALKPNEPLTEQIVGAVRQASLLLVILSPSYLKSNWCQKERNEFLQFVKDHGHSSVFLIEKYPVEPEEKPEQFRDLTGFTFYSKDEAGQTLPLGFPVPIPDCREHAAYYLKVRYLCECLAKALRQSSSTADRRRWESGQEARGASEAALTVFLAPVDYDLEAQWESVQRYLDQAGVKTLPHSAHAYPSESEGFIQAVEADLAACGLFVQLLGANPFLGPTESTGGLAQVQLQRAEKLGKLILQWRHPQMRLDRVADPLHRALLDSKTVRAESLEDFKQEVRRRAFEKPPSPEPPVNAYVLVDTTEKDAPLAHQVSAALVKYGALVLEYQAEKEIPRERLEDKLAECSALIVVYGECPSQWVIGQYKEWRKIRGANKLPCNALALIDGPPEKPARLYIPGMQIVDCRSGLDEAKLRQFLDEARLGASQ